MNCEDFSSLVDELAENRPMDATARVTGLAHVSICADCAARFNDAKNVSTGLLIAARAESEETPARVRESLLAAFAVHHKIAASPQTFAVISTSSSWRTIRWWGAAAVAVAAVIILALMLPALMRVFSPTPPTRSAGVKETQPVPVTMTPTQNPDTPSAPLPERKTVAVNNLSAPTVKKESKRPVTSSSLARKTRPSNRSSKGNTETLAKNTGNQYFPLTYLADATAMESGTVVRVQLSRSKLISLGLPLNNERADEILKADLVLGDDGVARAIRLVNE